MKMLMLGFFCVLLPPLFLYKKNGKMVMKLLLFFIILLEVSCGSSFLVTGVVLFANATFNCIIQSTYEPALVHQAYFKTFNLSS